MNHTFASPYDMPEGWTIRLLRVGEVIQEGDFVLRNYSNWKAEQRDIGAMIGGSWYPCFRPVPPPVLTLPWKPVSEPPKDETIEVYVCGGNFNPCVVRFDERCASRTHWLRLHEFPLPAAPEDPRDCRLETEQQMGTRKNCHTMTEPAELEMKQFLAAQLPEEIYTGFGPGSPFVQIDKNCASADWKDVTTREWLYIVSLVEVRLTEEQWLEYMLRLCDEVNTHTDLSKWRVGQSMLSATWQQRTRALMEVLK